MQTTLQIALWACSHSFIRSQVKSIAVATEPLPEHTQILLENEKSIVYNNWNTV